MKKYVVIGNPIEHSLSPILHNYWLKEQKINAVYEKKKLEEQDLKTFIFNLLLEMQGVRLVQLLLLITKFQIKKELLK